MMGPKSTRVTACARPFCGPCNAIVCCLAQLEMRYRPGTARQKGRVARALEKLPNLSAAMERGELSYSNVRALTRVACGATEEYLLSIAKHGTEKNRTHLFLRINGAGARMFGSALA